MLTLFRKVRKYYELNKLKKKKMQTKSILTFCAVKAAEQKRIGYLPFDINV